MKMQQEQTAWAGQAWAGGEASPAMARHYCAQCMALTYAGDAHCVWCEAARPAQGWRLVANSGDPWLGRVIAGRYLMSRRLGKGASARVYEAESLFIPRQFALKMVELSSQQEARDPQLVRARLRRELAALSRLKHPHIAAVFEVLELSQTSVGVVMELVEGPTLHALLKHAPRQRLPWARACELVRQIASACHAVHAQGLVHRDLKPANIVVETLPCGQPFIHLLDFGIVWANDGVQITRGFVGTPLYASPEQALGTPIDARSDIYSLGTIFFEMLTGQPPFRSPNVMQVLRMQAHQPAPSLHKIAPDADFPPALCRLVASMLSKERARRPQALTEVIARLDELCGAALPAAPRPAALVAAPAPAPASGARTVHGLPVEELGAGYPMALPLARAPAPEARAPMPQLPQLANPLHHDSFVHDALLALQALSHPSACSPD